MKELTELLRERKIIFKSMVSVAPKELGIRNRVGLYYGQTLQGKSAVLVVIEQKSRVLQKEVEKYEAIVEKLMAYASVTPSLKLAVIYSPLCSKAKARFIEEKWRVFDVAG